MKPVFSRSLNSPLWFEDDLIFRSIAGAFHALFSDWMG
jgi:hypothetical protein